MHNSVMFEFPEDDAFLKEGRYYTLEAVSLFLSERRRREKKRKEQREGRKLERKGDG